jgi:hypothetical protein
MGMLRGDVLASVVWSALLTRCLFQVEADWRPGRVIRAGAATRGTLPVSTAAIMSLEFNMK